MPVSPQDFELYSRMTGTPMPTDAMSRMQMAPEVFKFTKDFAKKPNILEKTGNLVKNIGRGAVMALGAPLVAASEAENARMQEQLRNQSRVTGDSEVERVKTPAEIIEDKRMARLERTSQLKQQERDDKQEKAMAILKAKKADLVDTPEIKEVQQTTTTADTYGQDFVPNQTSSSIVDRKMEQGSQIADSTPNIAEVLSESQDSMPASMFRPTQMPTMGSLQAATPVVGSGFSKSGNEVNVIKGVEEEMVGSGATSGKVENFLKKMGGMDEGSKLDVALLAAMQDRDKKERFYLGANSGDPALGDSPLIDHPDLPGGEDDINLPSGTNTSPTTNLEDHYSDMRRMEAQERRKRKSPSDKQINLLEQRAIDNQEAIDSGFMSMSDEERANETARLGGDRIREMAETSPDAISETDLKRTGVLSGQLTRFPAGEETEKATERKRLRREKNAKADDFKAKFVEGALSNIVRGARGNKSLGITRIPATNGDAQVGFVLANKPLDQSPTTATTYGFGVAPGAESLLDNQLNRDSFSDYMKRGMSEAKQGKKRKAGEIFEYLPQSARVVGGTASLGDIVM